jgi:hypothetical protein
MKTNDAELKRLHRIGRYVRSKNIRVHEYPIEEVPLDAYEKQQVGELNGLFHELQCLTQAQEGREGLTERIDRCAKLLGTLRTETRPVSGHSDPGAIEDCWREAFDELVQLEDALKSRPIPSPGAEGEAKP